MISQVMKSCWDIEPEDRPSFQQLVTSFEQIGEDDAECKESEPELGNITRQLEENNFPKSKIKIKNEKENKYDNEHLHGKYRKKKKAKKYENQPKKSSI